MIGMRSTRWIAKVIALVGTLGLGLPAAGRAAEPAATGSPEIATLEAIGGEVVVIRLGQTQQLSPSAPLQLGDIVVTQRGRATVRFQSDGTVLRIGPGSRVQIDETAKQRDITVFFGRLWAHVVRWKERTTRFSSNSTIAAIRGTEVSLSVAADGDETELAVLEGHVEAQTDAGSLQLAGGQVASGRKGSAPTLAVQVRPRDAVRWALYYMPVLHIKPAELQGEGWQARVRESTESYLKGDVGRALEGLKGLDEVKDPRFFTYRASLLLATGGVDEAAKDIERALGLAPGNSDALSLQAIVAVANNENDKALEVAEKAAAADPHSATAQIALSYARQARFDLDGARENLEAAVQLDPEDPLAWARLAEIRSSSGYLGEALEAARKASDLEPNLARTQTVLGYAYLMQVKTGAAQEAFRKAIALDQADPLPRLGLGLAEIRDGKLTEGSREIEVAVSLDPQQSLVRSYLGKAYYEAKRAGLVEREYDVAKEADPKDPTPWFYDAIAKQTTNEPVAALESLQKAIELNDNRAVYRSRLLLDSDQAARSASLGRIYSDLGFQDLALVEGWSSLDADPSNYSAHRLLADSYAALPRHEIARVSELFQSQMLQPLNTTPIQPSLGESSLFLISSQGPGTLAFNEFNPLFNRDQANVQGSGLAGENGTWSGEGIVSGIYKKASFSAGYSGFQTDGFRVNNSQDDKIANVFAQVEASPSTSLQAEVRHRKLETGDLGLRFFEDDFSTYESDKTDGTNVRVGLRQNAGPAVTFLASYMHSDKDIDSAIPNPDTLENFSLTRNEKSDSFEGQVLFRAPAVKVVAGGGYFNVDSNETTAFGLDDPDFGFTITDATDRKEKHTNLYAYSYIAPVKDLTLTLGLSGDLFDETGSTLESAEIPGLPPDEPVPVPAQVFGKKNQANPKVGVSWTAASGTTLRAAWFKALKRTLITDQTLEPTQVAGFNQFFDDPSATESKVYGAAVDQKLGRKAFAGAEYSRRELTIPHILLPEGSLTEQAGDERLARAYLFAAPHPWLSFSAEYQYEKLDRDPELFLPYTRVKTQRVPLSARFFHPSGVGAMVGVTYLKQDGDFRPALASDFVPGNRSFWVVNAAVRYRLPRRYGFLVVGANNLTDEKSTYQATDSQNLDIRPGRVVYGRVVVAFP
jgi:Tfp pilus assembly protein PilF